VTEEPVGHAPHGKHLEFALSEKVLPFSQGEQTRFASGVHGVVSPVPAAHVLQISHDVDAGTLANELDEHSIQADDPVLD